VLYGGKPVRDRYTTALQSFIYYIFIYLSISVCLSVRPSIRLSIFLFFFFSFFLSFFLSFFSCGSHNGHLFIFVCLTA